MESDRTDLRRVLVREAMALLGDGTAEISLRSVARAAGVSAMAPYRHFPDKAALLGAVAEEGFRGLQAELEAADAAANGADALVAQGLAYIAFAARRPALFRLMFAGRDTACIPREAGDGAYGVLARRVAALSPGDHEARTLGCWAMVHGLATLSLDGRLSAGPESVRPVLALLARDLGEE
ncbi:TetR/AcrR family transcriptional regulator [uncultured Methylobacterium sp.]|uniref:TetR/AcrR family transcriptional regulator n=1 Tax=uncultured Methylobacterium sp. TaxID=157278 RepID=UPI002624FFF8|nr:TetR/AcrR family transcriptional regulator [uncultured Methylobacterium sp.]